MANPHKLLKRVGKARLAQLKRTLRALASLEVPSTPAQVDAAHQGPSKYACTRLWDLQAAGLVVGHGQDPELMKGVSETYEVSPLGKVSLAWTK